MMPTLSLLELRVVAADTSAEQDGEKKTGAAAEQEPAAEAAAACTGVYMIRIHLHK